MKAIIFALTIWVMGSPSWASMECAGLDGKYLVKVEITTSSPPSRAVEGKVEVFDGFGTNNYLVDGSEIGQYFERDLFSGGDTFVGVSASVASEAGPIDIFYNGHNYADQDLGEVLKADGYVRPAQGQLVVWKGPGFAPTEQFQITDFVCGVWSEN